MNEDETILYKLNYNLTADCLPCSGTITVNASKFELSDGDIVTSYELTLVEELKLVSNIGSGQLEALINGEHVILCRFTLEHLENIGEFCKAFNYMKKFGQYVPMKEKASKLCPKCGRRCIGGTAICIHCAKKTSLLSRAVKMLGEHKKPIIISGLILTFSNLLYILVPYLNGILVDDILQSSTGTAASVLILCGAIFLARAIGEVLFIIATRISCKASLGFANNLRNTAYDKIQKMSMTSLSQRTSGTLMKRVTSDTNVIKNFIIDQGRWVFEQGIVLIAVAVILFCTNPVLAALIFIPVPLVFFITMKVWNFINKRYEKQWRYSSRCDSLLHDIISGIKVVKTFGREDSEVQKFSGVCRSFAEVSSKNEKMWSILFPSLGFLLGLGEFLVLYFGSNAVLGQTLSLGEMVQFILYIGYIYAPLRWLTSLPRWFADALTSLVKIFEIIDEEPSFEDVDEQTYTDIGSKLSIDNVTFGYKAYEPVLRDVCASIKPGEMVGLVGHSGSGKSTMINLIMRLYDVNSGSISIGGKDLRDIPLKNLHENIGIVFQETFLFVGSIYDNIAYTKPDATYDEVIAAAKIAAAHEFIIKLPDAYNTVVGENGHSLSGGERQRISIARAILRNPSLLILDEATSSLDADTENKIQAAMSRLIKGRTTIAIAHRLSTLKNADRLIVLEKGRIAESGTHKELLNKKGIYYNLVMSQLQMSKRSS